MTTLLEEPNAMNMKRGVLGTRAVAAALFALLAAAPPAQAIFGVDMALKKLYKDAREILIARVDAVDADGKQARLRDAVTMDELGKKVLPLRDRSLTVDLTAKPELARRLKPGAPVVIFAGQRVGAIHAADGWWRASRRGSADWRVVGSYALDRTFPGTTASLIRALLRVRAGQAPMVDAVMHHTWAQSCKLQALDVKGKAMASADADGDGKADLAVLTDRGVRLYRGNGPRQAFTEATARWGLADATARQIAFDDATGDDKPDLLLDELFVNAGGRFRRSAAAIDLKGQDVLAVALMDATADGKPDALALARDGTMTVYENPGKDAPWPQKMRKPIWRGGDPPLAAHIGDWGDDGSPHAMVIRQSGLTRYSLAGEAADLKRLSGETPMLRDKPRYFPMADYLASAAWDRNGGDGNLDLHVVTRTGKPNDLELVGRGHGAFFLNHEAGTWILIKRNPQDRGRRYQPHAVAMAPADMYGDGSLEMLILEENGDLWQKDSPVYVRGKPIDAGE